MNGSTGAGLQSLTMQIACAFSQAMFARRSADGAVEVPLGQAHVFAAGRMDLWDTWPEQPERLTCLVGRFLRIRHNDLAAAKRFREAAAEMACAPESPFQATGETREGAAVLLAVHGQDPLDLAELLIEEAEEEHASARRPFPAAAPGTWEFGGRERSVVEIPEQWADSPVEPIPLATASPMGTFTVSTSELRAFLGRMIGKSEQRSWQPGVLEKLLENLKDRSDEKVAEIDLAAGTLRLLNAPTGVGKSVLTRVLALYLASKGITVAIAVGTIDEALKTAEQIRGDTEEARRPAEQADQSEGDLALDITTCALVSPGRLREKAVQAAERGHWERFDRLAYGCELAPYITDGPAPLPGREPCTGLRGITGQGADEAKGRSAPGRAACPRIHSCTRHRQFHEAARADIIVTNHHNLIHGGVPVPVSVDGTVYARLSVLEFVMRRSQVLLIDEIDLFQSNMFDTNAQQLVLAARGEAGDHPLTRLDGDRGLLPPSTDRAVIPALSRTRFLAEQFLNYVLEDEVWLDPDPDRPSSGWHIPGANDGFLLQELFGIGVGEEPDEAVYERFNALFPDAESEDPPGRMPMAETARLLRAAVSNDTGRDELREIKHRLNETLKRRVAAEKRRDVVNALLVRSWLGSLHQALTRLTFAVGSSSTQLPSAGELATRLGTFVRHSAIPYGPLGQLLFGFKIDRTPRPSQQGRLSVQVISGDPHTTTARLGDTVALAAAGTRRIVLGLSATAFFPGAAREHVHAPTTYAMTDAAPGAFTTLRGDAIADDGADLRPVRIGGLSEGEKEPALEHLGKLLWEQRLDSHLLDLARTDPDRELALLVGNSYRHAALLASGIAERAGDPAWIAVVVPKDSGAGRSAPLLPAGVVRITIDEIEDLPRTHPNVKVCAAPLSLVSRGLNILVPGTQRSALASIWVCVRPVARLNDPAEMFASVNAQALRVGAPGGDPAAALKLQHRAAHARLRSLLAGDPRFTRLPRRFKAEVLAGILVDLIQLAGRARRGGTPVELYLVDHAFHDPSLGSDLPAILRFYHASLSSEEAEAMRRIYGSTLSAWLEFADIAPWKEGERSWAGALETTC
ncbi:hypothetical protein [Nocardiopsis potens]|uniref:hypothetical protein n=1 Tax=Nocardiopsis potens TaxID=1246458 RepID=UPI000349D952|nr:hypothetical protein [Nocardiopsis potens]